MTEASPEPAIDALILDLFGVVIAFDESLLYDRLAPSCRDPDEARAAFTGMVSQRDLVTGRKTLVQLHEELVANHRLGLTFGEFESAWRVPYSAPMPGMADLIRNLAGRYRLVLLSNVDRDYWDVVHANHPELGCFSALLTSCELGVAKPDRAAFLHAVEAARTSAAKCFFVDDKSENVDAARTMGIRGHVFDGAAGLFSLLEQRQDGGRRHAESQ